MTLTPTQTALLQALADWQWNVTSRLPSAHDLARHPEVAALGLDAAGVTREIQDAPDGLFMTKPVRRGAIERGLCPAFKGADRIRAEGWKGDFYAPRPKAAPAAPAPVAAEPQPAAPRLGWSATDAKYRARLDQAPAPGTVTGTGDDARIVTAHSKAPFYLPQHVIDDEDLFEYEGQLMTYVYHRPATAAEVAAHQAELVRLAARTPAQQLADEPVSEAELFEVVGAAARRTSPQRPAGDVLVHSVGYGRSGAHTIIRTAGGVAIFHHNVFVGAAYDSCVLAPLDALPPRVRQAVERWPALEQAEDDGRL